MSTRLIVSVFVTLDGVMEAPGGEASHPHTGWVIPFQGQEQLAYKFQEVMDAGSLLIGRLTYESFAGAWPGYSGAFADRMNSMPKYVVSTTLAQPAWSNTHVIRTNVLEEVRRLKQQGTAPIVVGGSRRLIRFLVANRLVDEFRIMTFPVILGSGDRFWPELPQPQTLRPTETRTFASGVVVQTYVPA